MSCKVYKTKQKNNLKALTIRQDVLPKVLLKTIDKCKFKQEKFGTHHSDCPLQLLSLIIACQCCLLTPPSCSGRLRTDGSSGVSR